ncbi:MAG TPA: hypothetical protein VG992_02185 [Candidatus Saccharimonadales bacterium]|nr:hypothetical protein [Candidatus Saccharimonadales bacterium]
MTSDILEELPPEEIAALRRILQQEVDREERIRAANTLYEHTKSVEVERLRAEGIEVQKQRFCWLRLRRHSYKGRFWSGRPRYGARHKLCINCGHSKVLGYTGEAARSALFM